MADWQPEAKCSDFVHLLICPFVCSVVCYQIVANLLFVQANSASYPQRDGKWAVATATGWRPSVADLGDGV